MEKYIKPQTELIEYTHCEDVISTSTTDNSDDLYTHDEYNA